MGGRRDLFAALVEDEVHLALADDLAHRGLGRLDHRLVGFARIEQIVLGIVQDVLHRELDVDDVLVVGEHQRFVEDGIACRAAIADLDCPHAGEIHQLVVLDRIGHAPAQARLGGLGVAAEAHLDPALAGIDDVEAAGRPDRQAEHHQHADAAAEELEIEAGAAAAIAAALAAGALLAEKRAPFAAEVAIDLLEIGRPLVAFVAVSIVPLVAPARIVK